MNPLPPVRGPGVGTRGKAPWVPALRRLASIAAALLLASGARPASAQSPLPPGADSLSPAQIHQRGLELAWASRYDEAIAWLRHYRRVAPDAVQGLVTLGRVYGWARRYPESLAAFDSAAARDPGNVDAAAGAAQTLAWAADWPNALRRYDALLRERPDDLALQLQYARTLGWARQYDSAAVVFTRLASGTDSVALEGRRGLARIAAWRGDLGTSIRLWSAIVAQGEDAEALAGLGQALRWSGNAVAAERALRRAAALSPDDAEIRQQLQWAEADAHLAVEPTVLQTQDSDGNRATFVSAGARLGAPWGGRLTATAGWRHATFLAAEGTATSFRGTATWPLGTSGATVRADAGATLTDGRLNPQAASRQLVQPFVSVGTNWRRGGRAASLSVARRPFDDIAVLIANGISTTAAEGSVELPLPMRLTALGEASWTRFEGGAPNARRSGAVTILARPATWAGVGGIVRQLGHSGRPLDGYFAPRRYALAEGLVRLGRERDLGWMGTLELGVGQQAITFASGTELVQGTQRVTGTFTWRPVPRFEVTTFLDAGRMASPFAQTGARYEYVVWGLRGRLPTW